MGHLEDNFTPVLYIGRKVKYRQSATVSHVRVRRHYSGCSRMNVSDFPSSVLLLIIMQNLLQPPTIVISTRRYPGLPEPTATTDLPVLGSVSNTQYLYQQCVTYLTLFVRKTDRCAMYRLVDGPLLPLSAGKLQCEHFIIICQIY